MGARGNGDEVNEWKRQKGFRSSRTSIVEEGTIVGGSRETLVMIFKKTKVFSLCESNTCLQKFVQRKVSSLKTVASDPRQPNECERCTYAVSLIFFFQFITILTNCKENKSKRQFD